MNGRRSLLVVSSVSAALVCVIGASCTFPDVAFAPPGIGPVSEAGNAEGSTSDGGPTGSDADLDASPLVDGADPDALIVRDAGMKVDAAGCGAGCDCDMDGFRDTLKFGCEGGANDCDDKDPRTKPGQGFLLDAPEMPRFGDWDCSGKVEKLYPDGFDCATQAPSTAACNNGVGFTDQPACGALGMLVKCKTKPGIGALLATCVVGSQFPGTQQACK